MHSFQIGITLLIDIVNVNTDGADCERQYELINVATTLSLFNAART